MRQGYDPAVVRDPLYFNDPDSDTFVSLDPELYRRIQAGQIHSRRRPGDPESRQDFVAGQISVPDDFDQMGPIFLKNVYQ